MKKNNILILTNFILYLISILMLVFFNQKLIAVTLFAIMTVITFNIEITKKNYILVRICYGAFILPIQILSGSYSGIFMVLENKYYILAYFILYIIGGGRIYYKERQLDI